MGALGGFCALHCHLRILFFNCSWYTSILIICYKSKSKYLELVSQLPVPGCCSSQLIEDVVIPLLRGLVDDSGLF